MKQPNHLRVPTPMTDEKRADALMALASMTREIWDLQPDISSAVESGALSLAWDIAMQTLTHAEAAVPGGRRNSAFRAHSYAMAAIESAIVSVLRGDSWLWYSDTIPRIGKAVICYRDELARVEKDSGR